VINQYTILREEVQGVLDLIEIAEDRAKTEAAALGCDVMDLRTPEGGWVMHDLLHSRIKALYALSLIKQMETAERN
jgi:hypothetical protein